MEIFFTPSFRGADRNTLLSFLQFYQKFLSELLETGRDAKGDFLFVKELFQPIKMAWEEMDNHFNMAATALKNVSDDRLVMYGLYGEQLKLKIAVLARANNKFTKFGGKSLLRRLLDTIDNLLGSILGAIGVGDALAEVKDSIKDSIDD